MNQVDVLVIEFEGNRLLTFEGKEADAVGLLGRGTLLRISAALEEHLDLRGFDVGETVATVSVDDSVESNIGDISVYRDSDDERCLPSGARNQRVESGADPISVAAIESR